MKIIFFNTNDLTIDERGVIDFITQHASSTAIFCFQEMFENSKRILKEVLPTYKKARIFKYVSEKDYFGQSTYINDILRFKTIETITEDKNTLGPGLYTELELGNKQSLHILNFHGMSRPVDKLDSETRLEQSQAIIEFFRDIKGPKIIGGDFNLFPTTKSISMLEEAGYLNLIKKYHITNTRNEVVWKKYPDSKQYYSDYVFVSPDVHVTNFEVPYNEISDHLPLILEVDIG